MKYRNNKSYIKLLHILLLSVVSLVFLSIFYKSFIINPNQYLLSNKGDGIKNYFAYQYHIEHDSSYIYFEGMNYPFGELHQFTDGNPFLSTIVKKTSSFFPNVSKYGIGILNYFIFVSFVIAVIFIYLILREYSINPLVSIFGAFSIIILSPQIHRISGHLSLAIFCSFPIVWYLALKFIKNPRYLTSIYIFLINLILLFIHPYLCVINIFFLFFLYLILIIKENINKKIFIHAIIQIIIPIGLWLLYIHVFDTHSNRPSIPFRYRGISEPEGLFLPNLGFLNKLINDNLFKINANWEGWGYIGIPSVIVFAYLLIRFIKKGIKREKTNYLPNDIPNSLKWSFWAGLITLLYSIGMPYIIGFKFLLNWFPFLQQIRALGRFSWVFYYVITTFTLVFVYNYFLKHTNRWFLKTLPFLAVFIFFLEGISMHKLYSTWIKNKHNLFLPEVFEKEYPKLNKYASNIHPNDYQAIIPSPFYHLGSENYWLPPKDPSVYKKSILFAYHTGIPLVANGLARTSFDETMQTLQLFSPIYVDKPIIKKMKLNKPLLILKFKNIQRKPEIVGISDANCIYNDNKYALYEILPHHFVNPLKSPIISDSLKNNLYKHKGFLLSDTNSFFYYTGFKNNFPEKYFNKNNSMVAYKAGDNEIYKAKPNTFKKDTSYNLSFWYYNYEDKIIMNSLIILSIDTNNNSIKKVSRKPLKYFYNIYGKWSLISTNFKIDNSNNITQFVLRGQKQFNQKIYIDDLMIRKSNVLVYKQLSDNYSLLNNRRFLTNGEPIYFD